MSQGIVFLHKVAHSQVILNFMIIEGQVGEGQTVKLTEKFFIVMVQVFIVLKMLFNERKRFCEVIDC